MPTPEIKTPDAVSHPAPGSGEPPQARFATAAVTKNGSTDAKNRFRARPTIHCRRSLQGPWHGPIGTQPSSAIVSALPTIAIATSAPIYLHLCSRTGARRPRCACTAHKVQRKHILISKLRGTHSAHATECVPRNMLMRMWLLCTLWRAQAQRGRQAPGRLQR